MRPQNKSRSRNKQGNNGGQHNNNNNSGQRRNTMGNIINRVFESAGPDGKVRGTPQQIIDKYQALARDAQLAGDRVAAESYLQHSEHYSRLLGEAQQQQVETRSFQERDDRGNSEEAGSGSDQQQRRPQPTQQPNVSSGLAMIDPEDSDDFSGPIETPENSRSRSYEPSSNGDQGRSDRSSDRAERSDRQDRYQERPERSQERFDRPDRQERPDRQDRPERQDRPDRPSAPSVPSVRRSA